MSRLAVLEAGGLVTVQDAGRPGLAHLGVPRAGWLDPATAALANRLVGNDPGAAVLEVAVGGLRARVDDARWVAVCGAPCEVTVDGSARGHGRAERLPAGAELAVGPVRDGVRCWVAIGGGVTVEPVLGSRATDTLAWVGPPRVEAGSVLPLGEPAGPPGAVDVVRPPARGVLRVRPGPRADWFGDPRDAVARLCAAAWTVADADRIGVRLRGDPLARRADREGAELPSEGMVLGAVQVPPDGQPVVFLADHPPTGGYPVVAVVEAADLARCAQLRPGDSVRFKPA